MSRVATVSPALGLAPFRSSDAMAAGLLTARQLDGPAWRRLFRSVYLAAGVPLDHLTWCQAAALVLPPGAALSHGSAAFLYDAGRPAAGVPVVVTARALRAQAGLRVVRAPLPPADVWWRGGLPVTSPLRTAFDLARGRELAESVAAVDALLHRRAVTLPKLREFTQAHAGWAGVRRARRVYELVSPGAESQMESRVRLLLVLGGLPCPVVQHEVCTPRGAFVARLDLAYPRLRVGVEYDGDHHPDRVVSQVRAALAQAERAHRLTTVATVATQST